MDISGPLFSQPHIHIKKQTFREHEVVTIKPTKTKCSIAFLEWLITLLKKKKKENKAENKLKIPYPSLSLSFLCLYTNDFLLFLSVCIHSIIQQGLPLKISTELKWIKTQPSFPRRWEKKMQLHGFKYFSLIFHNNVDLLNSLSMNI